MSAAQSGTGAIIASTTIPASSITAVPEPASLALVGAVAMFLLARGRRR
jgi:hypothetical protein